METFIKLFGSLLLFVYHCFDRVVINGYLSGLSRPGQVVHFFQNVVGEPVIGKEVLSRRTLEYQQWVEAFARNHATPIEWAEPKVRKEDYVRPSLRRMEQASQHGVYFILKSMEQGQTFRSTVPRYPTEDANYRILARQRSRFTHYYFYIHDETLGAMAMRVASFFPFQTTYYLNGHNFIEKELNREKVRFRKNDNAFLSVSDPEALQAAADRLTSVVIRKRLDYWTLLLGPKFSIYLRNEACSNNLSDFGLKKGLDHLAAVREKLLAVTGRFAAFQAEWLNVHVDFPLLQRLALPITVGTAKYPGIKIHDTRMIRLMEVLLHGGTVVSGWTASQIHEAILTTFHIGAERYGLNQLRYDLRKLKAHGLLARDGKRYAYRLTDKGTKVALLFILFHKQLCGPLANSLFHHQPAAALQPNSKLETAFHKADHSIRNIIQLLEAA